jgi:7-carboxy-7-deazaguanine synthase
VKVTEIFLSIQGESSFAGRPCAFVRLTECNLRCVWCDTAYAFSGGVEMSIDEVVDRVGAFGVPLVEVTGGEPLLQEEALPLMARLADLGFTVLLETGGSLPVARVDPRVVKIVDLKCPGSGESEANLWENLEWIRPPDEIKFVVAGRSDYEWARGVIRERALDRKAALLMSPVHGAVDLEALAGWILEDRLPVRLQLQMHKQIFGADRRGV